MNNQLSLREFLHRIYLIIHEIERRICISSIKYGDSLNFVWCSQVKVNIRGTPDVQDNILHPLPSIPCSVVYHSLVKQLLIILIISNRTQVLENFSDRLQMFQSKHNLCRKAGKIIYRWIGLWNSRNTCISTQQMYINMSICKRLYRRTFLTLTVYLVILTCINPHL